MPGSTSRITDSMFGLKTARLPVGLRHGSVTHPRLGKLSTSKMRKTVMRGTHRKLERHDDQESSADSILEENKILKERLSQLEKYAPHKLFKQKETPTRSWQSPAPAHPNHSRLLSIEMDASASQVDSNIDAGEDHSEH